MFKTDIDLFLSSTYLQIITLLPQETSNLFGPVLVTDGFYLSMVHILSITYITRNNNLHIIVLSKFTTSILRAVYNISWYQALHLQWVHNEVNGKSIAERPCRFLCYTPYVFLAEWIQKEFYNDALKCQICETCLQQILAWFPLKNFISF